MTTDNAPENLQDSDSPKNPETPPSPPAVRPRRKRLWLKVSLGIVLLLVLLIALAPTLLSTSAGRTFVVGKINENLNGRVDIADWKVSWTGGVVVNGMRVFDDQNRQIAQVESIATQLSLLGAVRGNLALGDTFVRGADFTFIQNPDGTNNFSSLAKPSDKPDEPASDLPNLSGNIRIENTRGTIVRSTGDPKTSVKVKLTDVAASAAISDINAPIDHTLSLAASVNDGPAGSLAVKGKAGVVAGRRVNLDSATIDESIELKNLDAGAIAAFLPADVVRELAGQLNGAITAKLDAGKLLTVAGQIEGKQVAFATSKFAAGERYTTPELSLALPLTLTLPGGLSSVDSASVRTDGVTLKTGQVQYSLSADVPVANLRALAANRPATGVGRVQQTLSADLAALATMMPQTLGLKDGASLTSGRLEHTVTADLTSGQGKVAVSLKVNDLTGVAPVADAAGKLAPTSFKLDPVAFTFVATTHGGGVATPDLRDLSVTLQSGFANGSFTAPTLASLKGTVSADLAKLKQQLGKFLAVDDVPLEGAIDLVADSTGDPTRPADPATFNVVVTGTNINTAIGGKVFRQSRLLASVSGKVLRTEAGGLKEIADLVVTAVVGKADAPTLDVAVSVPAVRYIPAASSSGSSTPARYDLPVFNVTKAVVALRAAQADFGHFVPALRDYDLSAGTLAVTGGGSMVNGVVRFAGPVSATGVDLGKFMPLATSGPAARVRPRTDILAGYTLTADLDAAYEPLPDGGSRTTIGKLSVRDNRKLLAIDQASPVVLTSPKAGQAIATGKLSIAADLAQVHDLTRRVGATTQEVIREAIKADKPILITRGPLAATLDFSQRSGGGINLTLDGTIDGLTVDGNQPIVTNDKLTLALAATTGPDPMAGEIAINKCDIGLASGAATISLTGKVFDAGTARRLENVVLDLGYDAEKLWPMLRASMADATTPPDQDPYKDYVFKGKAQKRFTIGGSLPAIDAAGNAVATPIALRSLVVRGGLSLEQVVAEGMTLDRIEIPLTMTGGILRILDDAQPADQQTPPPIACNGGTIDLGGIAVNLGNEIMTLSTPSNLAILKQVQLTPALAKSLGDLVNNPLFVPSAQTRGIMDATILECRDVPMGKMLKVHSPDNKGYARATFSFSGAQLKNDLIVGVLGALNVNSDSLLGSVRDGKVEYKSGYIGHDMTFVLGERQERTLWLYGSVRLADNQMMPLTMFISPQWFSSEIARYAPKGVPLALTGSFRAPQYNFAAAVQETIKQNFIPSKPEDLINLIDLFGGKKKPDPTPKPNPGTRPAADTNPPATQQAKPKPTDPFDILGGILGEAAKERERKEQEKKEKERKERERKERERRER